MNLYPVPETRLDVVLPLIEQAHNEIDTPKLSTLEQSKKLLAAGYAQRTLAAYVDDIKDPKHLVILGAIPGVAIEGVMIIVHLVYSIPGHRGNLEAIKAMHKTIDGYAASKMAGQILGTSWEFGNSQPIDKLWTSHGYVKQSVNYIKELE